MESGVLKGVGGGQVEVVKETGLGTGVFLLGGIKRPLLVVGG